MALTLGSSTHQPWCASMSAPMPGRGQNASNVASSGSLPRPGSRWDRQPGRVRNSAADCVSRHWHSCRRNTRPRRWKTGQVAIQMLLPDQGRHRAASIPDLIAATAEIAGLTVLHLDKDFDLIAEVTN